MYNMDELKIRIFQFDIQWLSPKENSTLISDFITSTTEDVDLIVLPEMYLSGFCMDPSKSAIKEDGEEVSGLISLCKTNNIALIGSLAVEEDGKYYNRVLLITPKGIEGRYDKQYLYSPSGEGDAFTAKYDTQLLDFKGWKILPQVCYDLRFPENVRSIAPPDVLIYMANWPLPRIHHWESLLKARSIENLCFTIGCNRIGKDGNDWEYPGHSQVIGPNGAILFSNFADENPTISLSKEQVKSYRSKYRFLEDKKS